MEWVGLSVRRSKGGGTSRERERRRESEQKKTDGLTPPSQTPTQPNQSINRSIESMPRLTTDRCRSIPRPVYETGQAAKAARRERRRGTEALARGDGMPSEWRQRDGANRPAGFCLWPSLRRGEHASIEANPLQPKHEVCTPDRRGRHPGGWLAGGGRPCRRDEGRPHQCCQPKFESGFERVGSRSVGIIASPVKNPATLLPLVPHAGIPFSCFSIFSCSETKARLRRFGPVGGPV